MSHWSEHHKELPFGTPEPFLIHKGEIVNYGNHQWVVNETFRKSRNAVTGESYENKVFAAYELLRYEGLHKVTQYITKADIPDITIPSGSLTFCATEDVHMYSQAYLKLIGK
ncbi:hypothetical protein Acj9p049 [Acinetobacter phage Acj9]|uniref:Uncharacterized protein n=1 Tax=Acinetobacter phage Acj9 TaxID=760939 RepID=E5EPI3_9CAUD|nr:hypothetical protein Acj9p049 [Acinetobacter phage Acj9]ADG59949.1 hypothetical protein Acj9p049 [Acinetobacter phage Acj9]